MQRRRYEHTQHGWFHFLFVALGLWTAFAAVTFGRGAIMILLLLASLAFFFCSVSFARLTVRDEGETLRVFYGPFPWIGKRIAYADIDSVEPARSSFLDGWGIRWNPRQGWIYNLSGFDCVRLGLKQGRRLRIGTDDRDGLVRFLRERLRAGESVS